MRVIAGKAGGIPLTLPDCTTRPTTDRVREAVFSSLGDLVAGAAVLDLYAGSGALGIEALSRGAVSADFVEKEAAACSAIEKNLSRTRLPGGVVIHQPVAAFLRRGGAGRPGYDLVFADPPYSRDGVTAAELDALLASGELRAMLAAGAVFVLESIAGREIPASPEWEAVRFRDYGGTRVNYLRKQDRG